jgi:ceramide glucosyltransferase
MIQVLRILAATGTVASIAYCGVAIWAAIRFRKARPGRTASSFLPPISVLKPLKGTDPEMYKSLRSHCLQIYPEYEVLFGASDRNDPAAAVVEKLQLEFPERDIRLLHCEKVLGANGKVSNLAQMAAVAKHDYLIVNDSDIRVQSEYLATLMDGLLQPHAGMVTCLYRGVPAPTLGSRLESLGISTDFSAGVLVAREMESGLRFGLGSTLALRKSDLQLIGGFEAIADYLADDYELGRRIAESGRSVVLSSTVVDSFLPPYDFRSFIAHQLRWARTIRVSRPTGYLGLLMTFTLGWALLCLALAQTLWAWALLCCALMARGTLAVTVGEFVLNDKEVVRSLWLLPVRDLLAVAVWIGGLIGRKIVWRGEEFLVRDGKLERA